MSLCLCVMLRPLLCAVVHCCQIQCVSQLPKLFDQLELLLTSDAVPLDLRDTATRTWTLVQQAQRDWERIQQENLAKKKAIEDAEAVSLACAWVLVVRDAVKRRLLTFRFVY